MFNEIDEKDTLILKELKNDSRLSVKSISEKINIPATTVHNRIKKLVENGVIQNFTININDDIVKGPIITFILIKASSTDQNAIMEKLFDHEMVEEVAIVTGENDLIVRTRVKSMEDLNDYILNYLRKIDGIASSVSMISLKYLVK
ncbi:MAG: putative HTH-type transcriptional regulator [Candidatus Heimdallarchaeota archaeon LC_3]|nr:MAG: putative HTH-type transcriptional regulator [Candidatus Heimdallarchaeota archaeon LC_3]